MRNGGYIWGRFQGVNGVVDYHLVMTYSSPWENHHAIHGKIHELNGPCSIATSNKFPGRVCICSWTGPFRQISSRKPAKSPAFRGYHFIHFHPQVIHVDLLILWLCCYSLLLKIAHWVRWFTSSKWWFSICKRIPEATCCRQNHPGSQVWQTWWKMHQIQV